MSLLHLFVVDEVNKRETSGISGVRYHAGKSSEFLFYCSHKLKGPGNGQLQQFRSQWFSTLGVILPVPLQKFLVQHSQSEQTFP